MNEPKSFEPTMASGGICADPLSMAMKPQIIFKFASSLMSIVTYSCISAGWYEGRCLFNGYSGVCRFGSMALVGFVGCTTLLVLEILFNQISSIKVRRRIVIGDVVFSGGFTVLYILLFVFLGISWLKSDYPPWGIGINSCRISIVLSFLSIFSMSACAALAYIRYQSGVDMPQFVPTDQYKNDNFGDQYANTGEYGNNMQISDMKNNFSQDHTINY